MRQITSASSFLDHQHMNIYKPLAAILMLAGAIVGNASQAEAAPSKGVAAPKVEMPRRADAAARAMLPATPMRHASRPAPVPEGNFYFGYLGDCDYYEPYGIYRVSLEGEKEMMWTSHYLDSNYMLTNAWLRNGRLCALSHYYTFSVVDYRYEEYDPYTGEWLDDRQISLQDPVTQFTDYLPYYISTAYDSDTDTLYGYTCNSGGTGYAFFMAPEADPDETVAVLDKIPYSEVCASICYNPSDKCLYGVNRENRFVRIEKDGTQTTLFDLGCSTVYATAALLYDADNDWFIWNACLLDRTTHLWAIDLNTESIIELSDLPNGENFLCLFQGNQADTPQAISSPIVDRVRFERGSNSGTISYYMPDTYFLGDSLSGELTWVAEVDGIEYSRGAAETGNRVEVAFSDITTGNHTFTLHVLLGDLYSTKASSSFFVGFDEPCAPEGVTFDGHTVAWNEVIRGVNGGYIDREALLYHVYLNGAEVGTTPSTSLDIEMSPDAPYGSYSAYVVADNHGTISEASASTKPVSAGQPWQIPARLEPTRDQAAACVAVDADGDTNTWGYAMLNDGTEAFCDPNFHAHNCDDYLFLPPMAFDDPDAVYELTIDVANRNSYPDVSFSAALYSDVDPAAKVADLIPRSIVTGRDFSPMSQVFTVPAKGVYYVAFHTDNSAYKYGVRICHIDVVMKRAGNEGIPTAVTNLSARGADKGELKAMVSFTFPTTQLNGAQLDADTELTAVVAAAGTATVTGLPGQAASVEVETLQGDNEVTVDISSEYGKGQRTSVRVYTGFDIPEGVDTMQGYVTADNMTLHCEWTPPTAGENGYYIDPAQLTYRILQFDSYDGWVLIDELPADAREYDFTISDGSQLQSARIGVAPASVAGQSGTINWLTDVLGKPYTLPMREDFADAQMHFTPVRIMRLTDEYTDSEWGVVDPERIDPIFANESHMSAYGRSTEGECRGCLMLPKFSTVGIDRAGAVFRIWNGEFMPAITIYGDAYGLSDWVELATVEPGNGWNDIYVEFPESMQENPWCAIYFDVWFPSAYAYCLIENYEIRANVSGVGAICGNSDTRIVPGKGCVQVEGVAGGPVAVYYTDGRLIFSTTASGGTERVALLPGIYVVKAGDVKAKVMVSD